MAVFKCKMCGGTIEFEQGASVGICDSCGTKQTLPRLNDDKKANLYDRANHFRRNNDFDKAMNVYERILNEDNTDAEAYWSLVLCRYGIEYVEDPATRRRVPTVNRAQFTSIYMDENYRSAIQYADIYQKSIYEAEAKAIDEIQKGILEISAKEEPFDVFICYKETDNNGRRTQDSVLANDLYHQLTAEGFKVFFSRITLEDKLGIAYEPYIFAALNSAKVMVAMGTKPEYFNAVWVKNEWSRYLALVKNSGGKKMLIPAYRDMDPYDLPEEFSHLQAQDMSKLGFMQDLIRGIKKIAQAEAPKQAVVKETVIMGAGSGASSGNTAPLLERVFLFLEDGKWQDANIYCEKVLDIDPKNAQAYLGKLMAELKVRDRKALVDCAEPFDYSDNFAKVVRFGDETLENEIRGYITHIKNRNENSRLTGIYQKGITAMRAADTEEKYKIAAGIFQSIGGFKDTNAMAVECLEKAEICRKEAIYISAKAKMKGDWIPYYEEAIEIFQTIAGWKDVDEQIFACRKKIEEIKIDKIRAEKKQKKALSIIIPVILVCLVIVIVLTTVIIPNQKLSKAMTLIEAGEYDSAYALLEEIGKNEEIASSKYDRALKLIEGGEYDSAYALLEEIGKNEEIASSKYYRALKLIEAGDYEPATMLLDGLKYKDSEEKLQSIKPQYHQALMRNSDIGDIVYFGVYEQDNDTSNGKEDIAWIVLAKEENRVLVISEKGLDAKPYNTSCADVTWESCSLRQWLNATFFGAAFSAEEQSIILTSEVSAGKNPKYGTNSGKATTDQVFLLSITEAEKYFTSESARQCKPTKQAVANGEYVNRDNGNGWWWLRSPGSTQSRVAYVYTDGSVYYLGLSVGSDNGCVRPALWISLDS